MFAGVYNRVGGSGLFHVYRTFVYLWILLGLSYLSVVIKYLMRMYLKRADKVKKRVSITMVSTSPTSLGQSSQRQNAAMFSLIHMPVTYSVVRKDGYLEIKFERKEGVKKFQLF